MILAIVLFALPALAHDPDNPEFDQWYAELMQPDHPAMSCCGTADAYWCEPLHVKDGKVYCTITDDRPDEPRARPHMLISAPRL